MTARQELTNDLCQLSDAKDYVFRGAGNQTLEDDNLLQRLISAASDWIRLETSRNFEAANYTEIRSGAGGRQLVLFVKNRPIISVSHLYIDGQEIPAKPTGANNFNTNGFSFSDSYISLTGYLFTDGIDNVEIHYQAGFNSVPNDLEQTCVEAVAWAYKEIDRLGQKSKILAGETVAFDMGALSERGKRALERYQRVTPGIGT
jgi:hypothetical protein